MPGLLLLLRAPCHALARPFAFPAALRLGRPPPLLPALRFLRMHV